MTASNSPQTGVNFTIGMYAIGEGPQGNTPLVQADSLGSAWSTPVRIRQGLHPRHQQFIAFTQAATQNGPNFNFAEQTSYDKYGYPWNLPVRQRAGLHASRQQFTNRDFNSFPTQTMFPWFAPLSEPVRVKPALRAALQRFYTNDPRFIPDTGASLEGWYNWFNEPVRLKPGLIAALQQVFIYHPRILPTPNVTATMDAPETNGDMALFSVKVYSVVPPTPVATARVSVIETAAIRGGAASIRGEGG